MQITDQDIDIHALLAETEDEASGALVLFGGTVRNENDGRPVTGMAYTAHRDMAAATLRKLEEEALARFDIRRCRAVHRTGDLALGDLSVLVVVRAAHRASAFDAARWVIDQLKQQAAIWKQEHYADGESRYLEGTSLKAT